MKNYWQNVRKFDRSILLYLFYWSMISFAYFGVVGVLLNLYLLRLGFQTEFIGLMLGAGQLAWAAFALPAGAIGARAGAKRAMNAGMLVLAVGTFLMLAAEALPAGLRPAWLVVTWMLSWIGASLSAVNGAPYLMAVTDEQTRGFAFSAQQTVMAAAGFAGSVAAGILPGIIAGQMGLSLEHPAPYRTALLLAPVAYLTAAWAFSRAKPAGLVVQAKDSPQASKAPVGLFLFLGVMIALQAFSEGTVRAFFNVYLDTDLALSTGLIGGIMGAAQLLLILVSLTIPAILARWGTRGSLTLTTVVLAAFILALAWAQNGAGVALAYLGINSMLIIMVTARGIYSQEAVAPRWRTMISAIATVGLALGWASAAWLGGFLVKIAGFQGLFQLGALFALLSAGLLIAQARARRPRAAQEAALLAEPAPVPVTAEAEEAGS